MIVYGTSVSPYVRKVLVSLFEKGVSFDHKPVPFHADDPGFQAASPTGKIPALDDDGFLLPDSTAILNYIEAKHPEPALIPTEAKARGRAVWFDKYGDTELFPVLIIPFVERFLKPKLMNKEGDEARAQNAIDENSRRCWTISKARSMANTSSVTRSASPISPWRRTSTIFVWRSTRSMPAAGPSSRLSSTVPWSGPPS